MSKYLKIGSAKKNDKGYLKGSICLDNIPEDKTYSFQGKKYVSFDIYVNEEPDKFDKLMNFSIYMGSADFAQTTKVVEAVKDAFDGKEFDDSVPF